MRIAVLLLFSSALAAGPAPVKLSVHAGSQSLKAGQKVEIQVALLGANNQAAAANKAMAVLLQARLPSGRVEGLRTVTIPAGESSTHTDLAVPGSGVIYIWAKNPELLSGGEYVRVSEPHPLPSKVAAPSPGGLPAPQSAPAPTPLHVQVAKRYAASIPRITLRFSPDRSFLADGKDSVTIDAFLTGEDEAFPADIHLNVYDGSNSLAPSPLTIHAGQPSGESIVTSNQPGTVKVELLGSTPQATFDGERTLAIKFVPPITCIELRSSPPTISLVDTAELIVTLKDNQGRPIATDSARQVAFSIDSGRGRIDQTQLSIQPGQFEARTRISSDWPGGVKISATTANLMTAVTPMQVTAPVALFLCSALGGLMGGLLARRTRRKSDKWRVPIGLFTGFLLYWACLFLGLAAIAHGAVLNPLSAFAISAIGGWLQTEVFSVVWGVLQPQAKIPK